jgi:quercetin dioxygenase-like cupin family protein
MVMTADAKQERTLSPGVTLSRIQPGGKDGPNGEVLNGEQLCGNVWVDQWSLGRPEDPWRLSIPDIRMARNQFWPMHWHDCWIAVIVLDGTVLIGDWWMNPGDVLISPAGIEYGPVLNGPRGCQLLEIFAQDILSGGGYAPEFHDHPTLSYLQNQKSGAAANFAPRPNGSGQNAGSQTTPLKAVQGLSTGTLSGNGQTFDLGEAGDPQRGVVIDSSLRAGETVPEHSHKDWRGFIVMAGSMTIGDQEVTKDDVVVIEPDARVGTFVAGANGVQLLEFARTAAGVATVAG